MCRLPLITNVFSTSLPEVYLIYFRLVGEKGKPLIVCDADKTIHFVFPGTLTQFTRVKSRFEFNGCPRLFTLVKCVGLTLVFFGRPLFFEAIHMEALRVFGKANLNHYFFSTAHVSNLIPLRRA